jgi:hypothetical protein
MVGVHFRMVLIEAKKTMHGIFLIGIQSRDHQNTIT